MQSLAYVGPGTPASLPYRTLRTFRLSGLTTKPRLFAFCALLTAVLGYVDYLTGYEQTFLLFYLVPIGLGTWFGGYSIGLLFAVFSIAAWIVSDVVAGVPSVGWW